MNFAFQKKLTGIEIHRSGVIASQIEKSKNGWWLANCKQVSFPQDVLKLSYKSKNIIDSDLFLETVEDALVMGEGRISKVGLSIPNEIAKISIQKFDKLPGSKAETEKMIAWSTEKSLRFPGESTKISYSIINEDQDGRKTLLVAIGMQDVIKEYEQSLKELKIDAAVIRPSGINLYNYYSQVLPYQGIVAFIGLYDNFFSFLVFEKGCLVFHHGIRKGISDPLFFQNIEMAMHYYQDENPEKEIERLYIGSHVALHEELKDSFLHLGNMEITFIDADKCITTDIDFNSLKEKAFLSSFAPAIGAAQSLVS